jgi:hypothetical protein
MEQITVKEVQQMDNTNEQKHAPLVADPITRQELQLESIRRTLAGIAADVEEIKEKLNDSPGV